MLRTLLKKEIFVITKISRNQKSYELPELDRLTPQLIVIILLFFLYRY